MEDEEMETRGGEGVVAIAGGARMVEGSERERGCDVCEACVSSGSSYVQAQAQAGVRVCREERQIIASIAMPLEATTGGEREAIAVMARKAVTTNWTAVTTNYWTVVYTPSRWIHGGRDILVEYYIGSR